MTACPGICAFTAGQVQAEAAPAYFSEAVDLDKRRLGCRVSFPSPTLTTGCCPRRFLLDIMNTGLPV